VPTKTTVAEFRDFYNDEAVWANDAWYEDLAITIDGAPLDNDDVDWSSPPASIPLSSLMTISGGVLLRPKTKGSSQCDGLDMEREFKRWRKSRTVTTVSVTVPNDQVEPLKAYIASVGGKVG
jgi:hypothetical protein